MLPFSLADKIDELVRIILHLYRAHVQHDERRLHTRSRLDCLERVLECAFAFARIVRREFENVRRGVVHAHRQRTEIVQAGNFYFPRIHRIQNSRQ